MAYNIQTKVVIQSASLELTGEQLAKLAAARDAFVAAVDGTQDPGLLAVRGLLNEIAAAVMGKAATPEKKPRSEAQIAATLAAAAAGRAAMVDKIAREKARREKAQRDALADFDTPGDDDDDDDDDI